MEAAAGRCPTGPGFRVVSWREAAAGSCPADAAFRSCPTGPGFSGELDESCCRELFHRASFHSVDMVTQRLEVTFNWLKSYLGETQENIETCSLRSCIRTISTSYRVSFLTGDPLNSLNTTSRVNWLINSLSVRYCKDICT